MCTQSSHSMSAAARFGVFLGGLFLALIATFMGTAILGFGLSLLKESPHITLATELATLGTLILASVVSSSFVYDYLGWGLGITILWAVVLTMTAILASVVSGTALLAIPPAPLVICVCALMTGFAREIFLRSEL